MSEANLQSLLEAMNQVSLAGINSGRAIGAREERMRAKPLLDALEAIVLDDDARMTGHIGASTINQARDAIAAYKAGK